MTTTSYVDPRTLSATARDAARATACADPTTRVTRSLAGYGDHRRTGLRRRLARPGR